MSTHVNPSIVQGNMDLDSHPSRIKKPDYRYAKNVRFNSSDSGKSWVAEGVLGNTLSFVIPPQSVQNVKYRISATDNPGQFELFLQDQQNQNLVLSTMTWIDFDDMIDDFDAELLDAGWVAGTDYVKISDPTSSLSYIYEFKKIPYYPYLISTGSSDNLLIEIIQDAIDYGIATDIITPIAGLRVLDNLFVWSSCQKELAADLNVTAIEDNGSGFIRLTVGEHGFPYTFPNIVPFVVKIEGVTGFNGRYMVTPVNATQFDTTVAYTSSSAEDGRLTIFELGYGQIGVVREIASGTGYAYTPLVKSVRLGFRIQKQITADGEPTADEKIALYWCDGHNNDRAAYVKQSQLGVLEGMLTIRGGEYSLATIDSETVHSKTSGSILSFVEQIEGGGALPCGNYFYTGSYITGGGTETELLTPTNEIPVYGPSSTDYQKIHGGDPKEITSKVNELLLSQIPPGVYKKFVLYCVRNVEGFPETKRVGEYQLSETDTSLTIRHTGNEAASSVVSLTSLNFNANLIDKSKFVAIVNRKLVRANFELNKFPDLTDFFGTFQHRIMRKTLPAQGEDGNNAAEFQSVFNVNSFKGYMRNDVYAFTGVVEFKNGYKTPWATYIDTISIDTDGTTNSAGATNRRVVGGTYTTFDLTDNSNPITEVYVPYVEFYIPDINFIIDGVPASSLIKRIWICMVEPIPEVLADGMLVRPDFGSNSGGYDYVFEKTIDNTPSAAFEKYGLFYSADTMFNSNKFIDFITGDKLINHGTPIVTNSATGFVPTGAFNKFVYVNGYTGLDLTTVDTLDIEKVGFASEQEFTPVSDGYLFDGIKFLKSSLTQKTLASYVIKTATDINQPAGNSNTEYICKLVQYKRPLTNKYGDISSMRSIHTNSYLDMPNDGSSEATISVFGGDTIVAAFNAKMKYASNGSTTTEGVRFYHQCRINPNFRSLSKKDPDQKLFPQNASLDDWLNDTTDTDHFAYNKGYNKLYLIDVKPTFNPLVPQLTKIDTGQCWSSSKAIGTLIDEFRNTPPFNIKIEEVKDGPITFIGSLNGELITMQWGTFKRQYFTSNSVLKTADNTDILLMSGEVMRANPQVLSLFGCQTPYTVIIAQTEEGGHQTLHWPNVEKRKFCRFGYDGTVTLSVVQNIDSWMQNNFFEFPFVPGITPAFDGDGIRGVHDARNNEIIWTVGFGPKPKRTWRESKFITSKQGDCVSYGNTDYLYSGSYQSDDIFNPTGNSVYPEREGQDLAPPGTTPATVGTSVWQTFTAKAGFTIVFNGKKKGFSCFFTPEPNIYFPFKNTYFTPNPDSPNDIYEHNKGIKCSWYNGDAAEDGYIEFVTNDMPSVYKKFEAVASEADLVIKRVVFTTDSNQSYLNDTDFTSINKMHRSAIKSDTTISADNTSNTGGVFGTWLIARVYLGLNTEQKILSFITKFTAPKQRPYNK